MVIIVIVILGIEAEIKKRIVMRGMGRKCQRSIILNFINSMLWLICRGLRLAKLDVGGGLRNKYYLIKVKKCVDLWTAASLQLKHSK